MTTPETTVDAGISHCIAMFSGAVLAEKFWGYCPISPFITESILSFLQNRKKYELHINLHFSSYLLSLGSNKWIWEARDPWPQRRNAPDCSEYLLAAKSSRTRRVHYWSQIISNIWTTDDLGRHVRSRIWRTADAAGRHLTCLDRDEGRTSWWRSSDDGC